MKLGLIHQLNENADQQVLRKIAEDIVKYAEGLVADQAAAEGGRGFSGDALDRKSKEVMSMLNDHVQETVKSYATWS